MSDQALSAETASSENLFSISNLSSQGLVFSRFFSVEDKEPFELVDWKKRTAIIRNNKGQTVFEQDDVEAPSFWSDMAVTVVASKYFRGRVGTSDRENSVKDVVFRVANTLANWGSDQGYFASEQDARVFRDELIAILITQRASFNSPVWFNVGVESAPQCSACFILGVEDTMESILHWYTQEGIIFKGGSGAGVNLSKLRSAREPLKGGGTASGPISFMKAADASAGVIKSGGKTRRAAKMAILNIDHPDILQFIRCKALEEKKAQALIEAGFEGSFEGPAYSTVAFQNSNHSVRVTDEFMDADEKNGDWSTKLVLTGERADTYKARDLVREIALAAYTCGDPGLQFDTTINSYNTCPETARISSSNPCSEYMGVDDSACNLASIKLTSFMDSSDSFDTEAFCHCIDVMITAQDILIDRSSYPTPAIARNARNLRALGLGFADLGALIMGLGLPYDSDEGRGWAAAISALLSAQAYLQSSRIAAIRRPFREFERNRSSMLKVLKKHSKSAYEIDENFAPKKILDLARQNWDQVVEKCKKGGFSNSQTTAIAPTGTVAFMMDCDTTGIEPELALIKYKSLSGGGNLTIVNRVVPRALQRLGYEPLKIQEIIATIQETGSIEKVEEIAPEHLPIFDCAFAPIDGKRHISPEGHIKMMAAVQPFISGGISKTVNLPNDCTVEDIEEIFRFSWKIGLKSITVYRDGCKSAQPVHTGASMGSQYSSRPVRRRLPVDCKSIRHKFEIAGHKGYIHTGFYDDGKVGEIFIRMSKEGGTISGLMDTIATLTSIALQYGVPLEDLVNKFSHVRFEPSGFTSNPNVPIAKSLTDYIFRYLGTSFLDEQARMLAGLVPSSEDNGFLFPAETSRESKSMGFPEQPGTRETLYYSQSDAPACPDCGSIMVRNGSCYKCFNCGATTGCS
ncbi:MAG: vitamin B12-dependent ribonucleotide reductase [Desulfomonilaceae bacterium]